MDKEKVLSLAKLARIEIGDKEAEKLTHDFSAILDYVGEITRVVGVNKLAREEFPLKNIMREDTGAHESSLYTQKILKQAPNREGDYIKVKKIL